MADSDPNQDLFRGNSQQIPHGETETQRPQHREPIFNQTPLGVAALIGVILFVHLISLVAGVAATQMAQARFGAVPVDIYYNMEQQNFWVATMPLVTHQFMHGGTLHVVMNLAMLLQAGPIAELGLRRNRDAFVRFILFFIACGICGALMYCGLNPSSTAPTIGASGAISGVFAGFLWAAIGLAKPGQAMLRLVITSAGIFLLINVGLAWVGRALGILPIAWESHLGGFLAGLVLYPVFARAGRHRPI